MDKNRELRFIISPFFFISSLLWGAYISKINIIYALGLTEWQDVVKIIGLGIIIVFPIGFIIGSITTLFLRFFFWIFTKRSYDENLSITAAKNIWSILKTEVEPNGKWNFYAAATMDHELLGKGIHEWVMRTWSFFTITVNACGAIILSHIVGMRLGIKQELEWLITSFFMISVFVIGAWHSKNRIVKMIEFQSYRILKNIQTEKKIDK